MSVDACAVCTRWEGRPIEVVDLPGSYSLDGPGDDQQAARGALLERRPDVVVAVADATNLARSLYLPLQLLDLGYRVVVALNLSDEAKRRGRIAGRRGALAGPRRPRGAHRRAAGQGPGGARGRRAARERRRRPRRDGGHPAAACRWSSGSKKSRCTSPRGQTTGCTRPAASAPGPRPSPCSRATPTSPRWSASASGDFLTDADEGLALEISKARHAEARALAAAAQDTRAAADRWWRLTTAPRTGIPIMLGVITAVFATLFIVGDLLARVLTARLDGLDLAGRHQRGDGASSATGRSGKVVLWGVDGGILATLAVGIPYILTFYFILALVEDTGYMNAAAFLSDRIMHRIGLHGRAIIPLIAAGGCNVPAIIAHALADAASASAPSPPCSPRSRRAARARRSSSAPWPAWPAGSTPCSPTR